MELVYLKALSENSFLEYKEEHDFYLTKNEEILVPPVMICPPENRCNCDCTRAFVGIQTMTKTSLAQVHKADSDWVKQQFIDSTFLHQWKQQFPEKELLQAQVVQLSRNMNKFKVGAIVRILIEPPRIFLYPWYADSENIQKVYTQENYDHY